MPLTKMINWLKYILFFLCFLYCFTCVRSPSPASSNSDFDWESLLAKSPDPHNSIPSEQDVPANQEESSKLNMIKSKVEPKRLRRSNHS